MVANVLKYWISHYRTRIFWKIIVTYRQLSITTLLSFMPLSVSLKDCIHSDNDEQKKEQQKIRTAVKRKAVENVYEKPIKIIRKELSSIEDSQ
ncbi:Wilms tumor protein isoform X1, partial [Aphis craccivora]